ncbi:hypothetical protein ACFQAT_12495 [Undibacterium arcticum]|uniref:Uncharacterized protein n=2 Tax=Undibacterium arcticum TaxID=1762892 RepID=A0ABV7F2J0_9BURK
MSDDACILPKPLSEFSPMPRTSAAGNAETTVSSVLAAGAWRILKKCCLYLTVAASACMTCVHYLTLDAEQAPQEASLTVDISDCFAALRAAFAKRLGSVDTA